MRHLAVIASLLLSFQAVADTIDFGQASKYNAFVKENYSVTSSDVEGRIAVGGNLYIDGGYDIGTQIIDYGMGDGPSLVVGGDIVKTKSGNFNVYQSATLPSPVLGDVVIGGTLTGGPNQIGSIEINSTDLPVDFNNAFAHLENLSEQLSARTAYGNVDDKGWALVFSVDENVVPEDGVYVFNVTQQQFTTDWYINTDGMADDATFVFNITNENGSVVDFSQANIYLSSDVAPTDSSNPLSGFYNKGAANAQAPLQVLYNFYGASQLNLNSDLYGSILAPTADIKANHSTIYGQVIGKSWEGNMQINYNPFDPVGTTTPVPEPSTFIIFAIAFVLMVSRNKLSKLLSNVKAKQVPCLA
jgi:choice-of-anchor A domain-containing protein